MEQQDNDTMDQTQANQQAGQAESESEAVVAEQLNSDAVEASTVEENPAEDSAVEAAEEGTGFDPAVLKPILEALLISADRPLPIKRMQDILSDGDNEVSASGLREVLNSIAEDFAQRSMELVEVSSGYRFQVRESHAQWVQRLWEEKPQRYSRALLETLAIIAYRQPITRGEIEDIRGVSVSSSILKTLQERDWCRVVGHRDVPGKPAMFATTRGFLDYFGLKSLDELPTLAELRDIDSINAEFDFEEAKAEAESSGALLAPLAEADTSAETTAVADTETDISVDESSADLEMDLPADEPDDDDMEAVEETGIISDAMAADAAADEDEGSDDRLKQIVERFYESSSGDDDEEESESLSDIVDALEERLEEYEEQDAEEDEDRS